MAIVQAESQSWRLLNVGFSPPKGKGLIGHAYTSKYKPIFNTSQTLLLTDPLLTDPLLTDPSRARDPTLAHRYAGYQFTQHDEHRHMPTRHLAFLQSCCFSLQEEYSLRNQRVLRLWAHGWARSTGVTDGFVSGNHLRAGPMVRILM